MKKSILFVLLSFCVYKSFAQPPDFITALNKRAIPLDSNLSLRHSDASLKISGLLKKLISYKALGLGEATHGTHDFFVAKGNLIKQLLTTSHFDRIGLEAPYAEVEDLNQYVLLGNGDLNGILKSFRQYTYETSEFRDIVDYIKNFNKTAKVKVLFYGYDFQSPYKVLNNLRAEIKDPQALLATDSLIAAFSKLSDALYSHDINTETYQEILKRSKQMYRGLTGTKNLLMEKNLKNYQQFLILNNPETSNRDLKKASAIRDSLMAANVFNEITDGHFMIVWAHNGHVQKSANMFSKTMGQHLFEKLNRGYAAIGLTTYQGFYTGYNNMEQAVVKTNPLVVPTSSQVEYFLNQLKYKNYIVSTTGLIVPSSITEHRFLGYGVTKEQFHLGNMLSDFDYIFFISTTTGSLNYYIKNK